MKRDAIKKRNDGRGPAPTCALGCKEYRPVSCEVLDPFTVKMTARCPRCAHEQTSIGDLRGLIDETHAAEDFAADFMRTASLGAMA